jgi:hypothetical protein
MQHCPTWDDVLSKMSVHGAKYVYAWLDGEWLWGRIRYDERMATRPRFVDLAVLDAAAVATPAPVATD